MLVLPPRILIRLAERIERAYLRHRPRLPHACAHNRVWTDAASVLIALHRSDSALPIDPELYVAVQMRESVPEAPDPWSELVHPAAALRYRRHIRRTVLALRKELRAEIRLLRQRVAAGAAREQILSRPRARVTALSCYIAAYRDSGPEAAEAFRESARRQHEACPLYRQASEPLLPRGAYPVLRAPTALEGVEPGYPNYCLN